MKLLRNLLLAVALAGCVGAQAAEVGPDVLAKTTTQEVLAIIKKDRDLQNGNQKKVLDLVETKVLPHFDFTRMTRLAVGRYWRNATPAQQQTLTDEFRTLLVRTYSNSLANYRNQTIEFKPFKMQPGETDVTIRTEVIQPGGQPIPIDYSMEKTAQGWKVYDVSVDGVSLVVNYRSSFASEIRRSGIEGLISTLAKKNGTDGARDAAAK